MTGVRKDRSRVIDKTGEKVRVHVSPLSPILSHSSQKNNEGGKNKQEK